MNMPEKVIHLSRRDSFHIYTQTPKSQKYIFFMYIIVVILLFIFQMEEWKCLGASQQIASLLCIFSTFNFLAWPHFYSKCICYLLIAFDFHWISIGFCDDISENQNICFCISFDLPFFHLDLLHIIISSQEKHQNITFFYHRYSDSFLLSK